MNTRIDSWVGFPFEWFGLVALVILFFMAATSHDFWLKNLGPRWWKTLHMGVYVAYASLVLHVALGAVQAEAGMVYPILIGGGVVGLIVLHIIAGAREVKADMSAVVPRGEWMDIVSINEIPQSRAKVIKIKGESGCERVAIFRHGDNGEKISAVASICAHQGRPTRRGQGR